jgi:hypothetical protein
VGKHIDLGLMHIDLTGVNERGDAFDLMPRQPE